eukprot:EC721953.1.p5 GENE.EC721953.1~~EC721953.1.p5  ORF type:complete len:51 (+),score=5.66 EC721953.1:104-256(+)
MSVFDGFPADLTFGIIRMLDLKSICNVRLLNKEFKTWADDESQGAVYRAM